MRARSRLRRRAVHPSASTRLPTPPAAAAETAPAFTIDPTDPLCAYFQQAPGPVDIDKLRLDSKALESLRASGVKLAVPLVSQGELIGVLNLGPRLSEQDYSVEDRRLLDNLASQAAPALRVAQLVREQEAEIRTRERYEHELRIAHLIQQNFLPREAPALAGWTPAAFYRSAREVGGDFYDFIELGDDRLAIVIGDVTDKGVPAALMMASTRSVIRSVALRVGSPGDVLAEVNDQLYPEMPPKMFVTCLYAVLDPGSGHMVFANAGHNVPYRRSADRVDELKACGMPLGLMPGSRYDEKEVQIDPGDVVLFTSDGITEAHSPDGEMFETPRLVEMLEHHDPSEDLRDVVLNTLHRFTGPEWEQEDDITMVTLQRAAYSADQFDTGGADIENRILLEFELPSETGNERKAMERVGEAVASVGLEPAKLEKLKTAVAEATMNAIEHGNHNDPDLPVIIQVEVGTKDLVVRITDHGGDDDIPESTSPDIDAKLRGEQTPRGWGLFLIKNMVDDMRSHSDGTHHIVELVLHLEGEA